VKRRERPKFKSPIAHIVAPTGEEDAVQLTPRELLQIKQSACDQAFYQAWFATALERTKSVFTLSSAGVGLSLTLVFSDQTKALESWVPVWLLAAIVTFAISSAACISVFGANRELVGRLTAGEEAERESGLVRRLDMFSRFLFGSGLLCLVFASIAQIWL